jgi:hypothetical protein
MARPLVVVGTPCFGGLVGHDYMMSLLRLTAQAPKAGFDVAVITLGHDALITRARSTILSRFLDNPSTTHLLFIDADISFEPEQVVRLLRFDRDVVAAPYPAKAFDWTKVPERFGRTGETLEEAAYIYVGELCKGEALKLEGGFATAQYAGTGFQLIKRQVFHRMIEAFPETKYKAMHVFPRPQNASENQYALFDCIIDPDTGAYLSEDYSFCRRWRQIGGEIWLDLEGTLTHSGQHAYKGNAAPRFAQFLARTAAEPKAACSV